MHIHPCLTLIAAGTHAGTIIQYVAMIEMS